MYAYPANAVVGLSQGGIIVRAYAEQYAGTSPLYPPVVNLVSVCGVLNGVWDCPLEIKIIPGLCELYSQNPYDFLDNAIPLSFADWFVTTDNKVGVLITSSFPVAASLLHHYVCRPLPSRLNT